MERGRRLFYRQRASAHRPLLPWPGGSKSLRRIVQNLEEWVEILETDGKPLPESLNAKKFSGKFVLRLEPALPRRLAAKAVAAGESLNSFCVKTLVKA